MDFERLSSVAVAFVAGAGATYLGMQMAMSRGDAHAAITPQTAATKDVSGLF
jgi:hypothetical protein